jgi:predicted DNA-binding transcriptional regulator YafY
VDRLERLVNLVAALIDANRPLTRADVKSRIEGYSDDEEAFRRNFERDKELLRNMGFPLTTVATDAAHPEDVGYQIPRDLYELPDPALDESELAALRLAASAVQLEGDWGREAVIRALRKLGGAAGDSSLTDPPRTDTSAALPGEDAAAVAFAAIGERRQVRFRYRGCERLVEPWRLSFHRGHWYLAGLDKGRGEERLFRLDRIEGSLSADGDAGAFARPTISQVAPPPAWRLGEDEEVVARLLVDADQARWAQQALGDDAAKLTGPDGSVEFEVAITNKEAFRSFVLGFLDHAEVLGPPSFRADMVAWLEGIARAASIDGAGVGPRPETSAPSSS